MGKGKDTVVVIHGGFRANHDYMLDAIRGLEKKYHFVLYDQRGSLLSPAPKEKLTFQKNVGDLDLLLSNSFAKKKKTKIMAHSHGDTGRHGISKQHPDKVSNLSSYRSNSSKIRQYGKCFLKKTGGAGSILK